MLKRFLALGVSVAVAVAVCMAAVIGLAQPAQADIAAPFGAQPANMAARPVTLLRTQVITQDTLGPVFKLMEFGVLDVQYVIGFSGTNTTTLTIRHSNDRVNWVTGTTILASGTSAGTAMTRTHNFGQWTAVYADVSNSNPVTLTVIAVAR